MEKLSINIEPFLNFYSKLMVILQYLLLCIEIIENLSLLHSRTLENYQELQIARE